MVAWINDVRSDEISARVTTFIIKHNKAVGLNRMFSGPIPPQQKGGLVQEVYREEPPFFPFRRSRGKGRNVRGGGLELRWGQ